MGLNETFLAVVASNCDFLCSRFGAVRESASEMWLARVWFRAADFEVELSYGDRELYVGTIVRRRLKGHSEVSSYALWEWLDAFDIPDGHVDASGVNTQAGLNLAVSRAAHLLGLHLSTILAAGPHVILRIEAAREARSQAEREANAKSEHSSAAAHAAEAFRAGDFNKVIGLLEPFASRLSPSEKKKLQIARRRVGGP